MEQSKNFRKRADRDPLDIEYERQKEELTFKPCTLKNYKITINRFKRTKSADRRKQQNEDLNITKQSANRVRSSVSRKKHLTTAAGKPNNQQSHDYENPILVFNIELDGQHNQQLKLFAN